MRNLPNLFHSKVKNYNLNVTEVLVSDFKNAFPGIFNFNVGILSRTIGTGVVRDFVDLRTAPYQDQYKKSRTAVRRSLIETGLLALRHLLTNRLFMKRDWFCDLCVGEQRVGLNTNFTHYGYDFHAPAKDFLGSLEKKNFSWGRGNPSYRQISTM